MDGHIMDLSLFNGNVRQNTVAPTTVSLTDKEMEAMKSLLQAGNRHNVFPNKFDRTKPFRVSVQFDGKWHNFGSFSNIEVATCVGAIASMQFYGKSANTGIFKEHVAQSHPEFIDWYESNLEIVEKATQQQQG